ncbi:hypothetical protein ACJ5H2_02855 [Nocardioides sp. R1-1]|uniref:hypothetical protein n=1 Tax=Nocardioides sp. R1-1 TaxID=3383502 RepID=UPI0038CF31E4
MSLLDHGEDESDQAMAACSAWSPGSAVRGLPPVCDRLRASIAQAVVDGTLPVLAAEED